jgi:hypothetical protein
MTAVPLLVIQDVRRIVESPARCEKVSAPLPQRCWPHLKGKNLTATEPGSGTETLTTAIRGRQGVDQRVNDLPVAVDLRQDDEGDLRSSMTSRPSTCPR